MKCLIYEVTPMSQNREGERARGWPFRKASVGSDILPYCLAWRIWRGNLADDAEKD